MALGCFLIAGLWLAVCTGVSVNPERGSPIVPAVEATIAAMLAVGFVGWGVWMAAGRLVWLVGPDAIVIQLLFFGFHWSTNLHNGRLELFVDPDGNPTLVAATSRKRLRLAHVLPSTEPELKELAKTLADYTGWPLVITVAGHPAADV